MKAIALLSGGLDSALAAKLILEQGVDVIALHFTHPFFSRGKADVKVSDELGISLEEIKLGKGYLNVIRKPKFGYGVGINPCIDCKIFMLWKAKNYANKLGAKFIVTGEVLGQRPMSQNKQALKIIEKESGLVERLVRPLSAKLLEETEAEKKGWINREKLLSIQGRGRKIQLAFAKKFGIKDYTAPAGGCLLTDKDFAKKVRDLFKYKNQITEKDIELLKIGRHFRVGNRGESKIIVGKNEVENKALLGLKSKTDYIFKVPIRQSPITLLQGKKTKKALRAAAELTVRYSDAKGKEVKVKIRRGMGGFLKEMLVAGASKKEIVKRL